MPSPNWSMQQLTEFLAAISGFDSEESAIRGAVERAAEAFDAELGAIVRDGSVASSIGFSFGRVPEQALLEVVRNRGGALEIAGVGLTETAVAEVEERPATWLVLARSAEPFDAYEASLLGGMARILALTLAMFRTIEGERVLLEQSELQREENAALLRTLAEQNEQLRQLDRMKDEFLGLVSHELRTPLTSIQGYLEMLMDDHLDEFSEDGRVFLSTISRNAERLISLVSDLLFLFQLDTHPLEIKEAEIELAELLEHAAAAMKPIADQKHVSLVVDADKLRPVIGDRARLGQLVDNLVSNAVKFTPDGGRVAIHGTHVGDSVAVTVSDTGIGIPADEIPLLFKRFFRTTNATANAIPGTGLGLAISQSIAHAHGTEIEVTSTPGEGTTFSFLLPATHPVPQR